uniref:Uncharacterized protein n=1 Tax=Anguilla anguilla TaxID=7936 RepID=A0A0E9V0R6_ANGAN
MVKSTHGKRRTSLLR